MEYTDYALGRYRPQYPTPSVYYSRSVAPTVEPLTVDEAVRHLQIAVGDDNGYIQLLIGVARDVAEKATGRAMLTQTWIATLGDWPVCPRQVSINVAPVATIASVKYYADGETILTTVDPANYVLASTVTPAVVVFNDDWTLPDLAKRPDAVQITFTAGVANPVLVDPALKHAVRILVRHYYDNPEAAATGNFSELPFGLRHLLESHRVAGWVA